MHCFCQYYFFIITSYSSQQPLFLPPSFVIAIVIADFTYLLGNYFLLGIMGSKLFKSMEKQAVEIIIS